MRGFVFFPALLLALALLFGGCSLNNGGGNGGDGDDDDTILYGKEFWGEWIRMDTGDAWYISASKIEGNSLNLSGAVMEKESEHVLKVKDGSKTYSLYASRRPGGTFGISIDGIPGAAASLRRSRSVGSMKVIVENIKNAAERHTLEVAPEEPEIIVPNIIPGDSYKIIIPEEPAIELPVNNDGNHLGNLKVGIPEKPNFKASILPGDKTVDMMRLYAKQDDETTGASYGLKVVIENNGTAAAGWNTAYSIQAGEADLNISGAAAGSLGGLAPGGKKEVSITVRSTGPIGEEKEKRAINVVITDITAQETWNDPVELEFKREKRAFSMASSNTVQGVVITPNAKTYFFKTLYKAEDGRYYVDFDLPFSSRNYIVVFSGANADTEAHYSMAVGVPADTNFNVPSPRPGNDEGSLFSIGQGEAIKDYLYKGALHYYSVTLAED
jgi:hypothetical protein